MKIVFSFFFILFLLGNHIHVRAENAPTEAINDALNVLALAPHHWQCLQESQTSIAEGAALHTILCNATSQDLPSPASSLPRAALPSALRAAVGSAMNLTNLRIQVVLADLTNPRLSLRPVIAESAYPPEASPYRQTVLGMAQAQSAAGLTPLAGINGGYFFFSPSDPKGLFFDSNCVAKFGLNFVNRSDFTTFDLGDGITVIGGRPFSWNCQTLGDGPKEQQTPARAAVLQDAQGAVRVENLPAGPLNVSAMGIEMALGCGPMLLQKGVAAMEWQEIPSTFEFSAYTGFALAQPLGAASGGATTAVLVTVDGKDKEEGMHAWDLASFLLEVAPKLLKVRVVSALSMDQGGSTSMVIRDPTTQQNVLVSSSGEGRSVFNALFLFQD